MHLVFGMWVAALMFAYVTGASVLDGRWRDTRDIGIPALILLALAIIVTRQRTPNVAREARASARRLGLK